MSPRFHGEGEIKVRVAATYTNTRQHTADPIRFARSCGRGSQPCARRSHRTTVLRKKRPKVKSISFGVPLKIRLLRFRFQRGPSEIESKSASIWGRLRRRAPRCAPVHTVQRRSQPHRTRVERAMQPHSERSAVNGAPCTRVPSKAKVKIRPCT